MDFDESGDPDANDQGRFMHTGAGFCDDCDDVHQMGRVPCASCRSAIPYPHKMPHPLKSHFSRRFHTQCEISWVYADFSHG